MNNTKLEIIQNELIKFENFKPIIKTFVNEIDTPVIYKYIDDKKAVFIKAKYPGCGKSQVVKTYDPNCLFVVC